MPSPESRFHGKKVLARPAGGGKSLSVIKRFTLGLVSSASLLAGCVTNGSTAAMYLNEADKYIRQGDWDRAYTFLEDVFVSQDPKQRSDAFALVERYPQIREAGFRSFSQDALLRWATLYEDQGGALGHQQNRLAKFCLVATKQECATAQANIQTVETRKWEIARDRQKLLDDAMASARVPCRDKTQCDKVFSLAQIYIDQVSDMKLQITTDTILETYNPTEEGRIGLKVVRMPGRGTSASVELTVNCRARERDSAIPCAERKVTVFSGFRSFIEQRLQD